MIAPQKFGVVSRFLHHSIAILMVFQFLRLFNHWNDKQNFISENLPPWHGSVGMILAFLVIFRIVWALSQMKNRHTEGVAAKAGHILLYVMMFLAPFSAIALMLAKGYGLAIFGWQIVEKGVKVESLLSFGQLHSPISVILVALVLGHIAMALFHQFVKKEKLIQKMFT